MNAIAVTLCLSLVTQVSDPRLARAVERIERNDVDGLRRLLSQDPSLVRRTGAGLLPHWRWTLLHAATSRTASLDVVGALVDAGSDVNAQDNEGNTPLHFAMKRISREKLPERDYEGIIRLLLEKKADVHIVNVGGATPLHTAAAFRADPSAVEILIQAGADVNLKALPSYGGWTPLHGAAARNSGAVVAVLLKYGADPTARDARGLTALQVAEQGGFADAAKALRAPASAPPVAAPSAAGSSMSTGGSVEGRVLSVPGATVYVAPDRASAQEPGHLRVTVRVAAAEARKTNPVADLVLTITGEAGSPTYRVQTGPDGTVDTPLAPGAYIVEPLGSVMVEGLYYRWRQRVVVTAGALIVLQLTDSNTRPTTPLAAAFVQHGAPQRLAGGLSVLFPIGKTGSGELISFGARGIELQASGGDADGVSPPGLSSPPSRCGRPTSS